MLQLPALNLIDPKGNRLLASPSIELSRGSVLAIVGPSGAGKSLFLNGLFGWAPYCSGTPPLQPSAGHYLMIQDPSGGLTPGLRLQTHFDEVLQKGHRHKALEMLQDLELPSQPEALRRFSHAFSGGELQRLMLALILCRQPKVLVCDEPAASLDSQTEDQTMQLIHQQQQMLGFTWIFVTHQLHLVAKYATHVAMIEKGQTSFCGTAESFFKQPQTPTHRRFLEVYKDVIAAPKGSQLLSTSQEKPTGQGKKPILALHRLKLPFGGPEVRNGFSLSVQPGSWHWLLGRSGSGKSSIAKTLCGLLQPQQGVVHFEGKPIPTKLSERPAAIRKSLQYLFQHAADALNPQLTAGHQLRRLYQDKPERLQSYLESLRIGAGVLSRPPNILSLGERQRIQLIKVLAAEPKVIVADELFCALDLVLKADLLTFLESYRAQTNCAMIQITHEPMLLRLRPGITHHLSLEAPTFETKGADILQTTKEK